MEEKVVSGGMRFGKNAYVKYMIGIDVAAGKDISKMVVAKVENGKIKLVEAKEWQ